MTNGDSARSLQWRRLIVDMLIGVSTVALGFALIDALTDAPYTILLLGAGTLVGIGLLIEPSGAKRSDTRGESQERFDAPIVYATSA